MSFLKEKLFFILFFVFIPLISNGQLFTPEGFYFTTEPQFPGPNEEVLVSIQSFSVDLNRSDISWYLNGRLEKRGAGERSLMLKTRELGTTENISVEVDTGLRKISEGLLIRPAELDIVWEAQTYAPTFYKGKRLYTQESYINVTAIPNFINSNGQRLSESSLIYTWKLNNRTLQDKSGIGKNSIFIKGSLFERRELISVTVESPNGNFYKEKSVIINSTQPNIIFYQRDPLYGTLLNRAIMNNFSMSGSEVSVFASPFFIGETNLLGRALSMSWKINNRETENRNEERNIITLGREGNVSGSSRISFSVSHNENILQAGERGFLINFGN